MNIRNKLLHFFKGFKYAFEGICYCIRYEKNMRFHIGAAVMVLIFSLICKLNANENCILMLTVGGVIALECVNTAIENTVDMLCRGQKNSYAKIAKDTAADAVLVMAVAALGVGIKIFANNKSITKIYNYFSEKPVTLLMVIVFIILWVIWVLKTDKKDKD